MKSEEEQCIPTGSQLKSSDAAPEDAQSTSADINQKRLTSNSQSPIVSPTCGHVASVSLVNQSFNDNQVLQGMHYERKLVMSLNKEIIL